MVAANDVRSISGFEQRCVQLGAAQTATEPRSGRINAARSHAQTASIARTRVDPTVADWAAPSQPFPFFFFPYLCSLLHVFMYM